MESSRSVIDSINSNKSKTNKCSSKSIRLTIDLNQKDENGCAVFNYQELVKAEKERLHVEKQHSGINDPFENEDEEALKKIALHYVEKYGGADNMRYKTYTELGVGYDENDSFIDNTEACEEVLDEDIEPRRGGFYVNTGKLEFKKVNHSSVEIRKSKETKTTNIDELENANNKSNSNKKNSKISTQVKEKSSEKLGEEGVDSSENTPQIELEVDARIDDKELQIIMEEKQIEPAAEIISKGDTAENDNFDTTAEISHCETSNSAARTEFLKVEPPKLPEISEKLQTVLDELKNFACNSKDSERNFFSDETSTLLYRLESNCRKELNTSGRHSIYKYLAHYLPIPKSTIVSKIKKNFVGYGQLDLYIKRIKQVVSCCTNLDEDESKNICLREIKPIIEKAIKLKLREYIVMSCKKKYSLEDHIVVFFNNLIQILPADTISINDLHTLVADTIELDAEKYKLTYAPIKLPKDPSKASTSFKNILLKECKTDSSEIVDTAALQCSKNTHKISLPVMTKEDEHKDDTHNKSPKIMLTLNNSTKDPEIEGMEASEDEQKSKNLHKKQKHKDKDGSSKKDSGKQRHHHHHHHHHRHHHHHSSRRSDENPTKKDESKRAKVCSADEKVQMQLDEVMQDIVVLNQMSSDTTISSLK